MATHTDLILIHYGELSLKGRNRPLFERQLMRNLEQRLSGFPGVKIKRHFGRLYAVFPEPVEFEPALAALATTFGTVSFSPVARVAPEWGAMTDAALKFLEGKSGFTFAVRARRVDKKFSKRSAEMNRELGAEILKRFSCRVDLENPEITVSLEVLHDMVFVYTEKSPGPGGLPVGCASRVVSLVSGGIDSPVATLRMMKRGCSAVLLHFHSAPLTDNASQHKVEEFAELLTRYQRPVKLFLVALAPIQKAVVAHALSEYRVLLYRRYMMRIAEAVAETERAKALVTGESLGQVASQTVDNMASVSQATSLPIFRPLIGFDKNEIIREAKHYGTFEMSIEQGQDCCSFMSTRNPATRSRARDLETQERKLQEAADMETLVRQAIETAECRVYK